MTNGDYKKAVAEAMKRMQTKTSLGSGSNRPKSMPLQKVPKPLDNPTRELRTPLELRPLPKKKKRPLTKGGYGISY